MNRISASLLLAALLGGTLAMTPPTPEGGMPQPAQPTEGAPPPLNDAPMNAPSAAPTANPAMLALAKRWLAALQGGTADRSQVASGPYAKATDATIDSAQQMIGNLGTPVSFVEEQTMQQGNVTAAIYVVTFKGGQKVNFFISVDNDGKIEGLTLSNPG